MSVGREQAVFNSVKRLLDTARPEDPLHALGNELIHHAQIFHLTITVPARKAVEPDHAKQIIESSFAWKRRLAVEEVIQALSKFSISLEIECFEDFCEAVNSVTEKPPTTLPPIPKPSTRSSQEPEGISIYNKMLDGLRNVFSR